MHQVTDDLGAEVYFGDLPLPLAVHVQCRVLDRWHALPPAVFALSAKTGSSLLSFCSLSLCVSLVDSTPWAPHHWAPLRNVLLCGRAQRGS
jgi:hypothetical protein